MQDTVSQSARPDLQNGQNGQNGQNSNESMMRKINPLASVVLSSETLSQPSNLGTIIANIIEHGEAIERRYLEMGQVDTEGFTFLNASHHLKLQSLPILDNLVRAWISWRYRALNNVGDPSVDYIGEVNL